MHPFFCNGVQELHLGSMKHKPLCRLSAVQPITDNRSIQSVRMRGMNAQLVGSSG